MDHDTLNISDIVLQMLNRRHKQLGYEYSSFTSYFFLKNGCF